MCATIPFSSGLQIKKHICIFIQQFIFEQCIWTYLTACNCHSLRYFLHSDVNIFAKSSTAFKQSLISAIYCHDSPSFKVNQVCDSVLTHSFLLVCIKTYLSLFQNVLCAFWTSSRNITYVVTEVTPINFPHQEWMKWGQADFTAIDYCH